MIVRSLEWVASTLAAAGDGLLVRNGVGDSGENGWTGAAVDSRADCSGRLFFALRGENVDGHRYVTNAFSSGSVAAIIDDESVCPDLESAGIPYFFVEDSARALRELARAYRAQLEVRVIAITGSAGKTTTKEYVRRILKSKYRVFANPGNFNSMIGVPVTILETDGDNEYLVSEVGANQPGEVGYLAEMLQPEIGVITNVGDAHVGMFGSVENIAHAKAELLDHVTSHGHAVLPRDDAWFDYFSGRAAARTVAFGRSESADFILSNVGPRQDAGGMSLQINGEGLEVGAVGEYNALNACAAFAVGDLCGVEHSRIREALAGVAPMPGRGRVHRAGGVTVVDESYNASPASMSASVEMLGSMEASRRTAVLGDMKELGGYSDDRHRALGECLAEAVVDAVFWLGDEATPVREGYEHAGGKSDFKACKTLDELTTEVVAHVRAGDAVLVKASRSVGLDGFVAVLLDRLESNTEN